MAQQDCLGIVTFYFLDLRTTFLPSGFNSISVRRLQEKEIVPQRRRINQIPFSKIKKQTY